MRTRRPFAQVQCLSVFPPFPVQSLFRSCSPPTHDIFQPRKEKATRIILEKQRPLGDDTQYDGRAPGAKGAIAPPLDEISFDFINNGTMIHAAFLMAFFVGKLIFQ